MNYEKNLEEACLKFRKIYPKFSKLTLKCTLNNTNIYPKFRN